MWVSVCGLISSHVGGPRRGSEPTEPLPEHREGARARRFFRGRATARCPDWIACWTIRLLSGPGCHTWQDGRRPSEGTPPRCDEWQRPVPPRLDRLGHHRGALREGGGVRSVEAAGCACCPPIVHCPPVVRRPRTAPVRRQPDARPSESSPARMHLRGARASSRRTVVTETARSARHPPNLHHYPESGWRHGGPMAAYPRRTRSAAGQSTGQ